MKRRCVSFIGNTPRDHLVAGNIDLHMDEPIASMDDIKEIQECIKGRFGLKNVSIMNIINYEEPS